MCNVGRIETPVRFCISDGRQLYKQSDIRDRKPTVILQIHMVLFPEIADLTILKASVAAELAYSQKST